MKYKILTILALAGSALAELFGGWDKALQTLVIFIVIDWITVVFILSQSSYLFVANRRKNISPIVGKPCRIRNYGV